MNTKIASVISRGIAKARDPYTATHLDNVGKLSLEIAKRTASDFGFSEQQIADISVFSTFHDIGKLVIPKEILDSPYPLTDAEKDIIKLHTVLGEKMIKDVKADLPPELNVDMLLNIIRSHHEFLDGSGYPDGLSGEEISPEVRIVTVADIFDAITTFRQYKHSWTPKKALNELQLMVDYGKIDAVCLQALRDYYDENTN